MLAVFILLCVLNNASNDDALSRNANSVHWLDHSDFVLTSEWKRKEIAGNLKCVARIRQQGLRLDVSSKTMKVNDEQWAGNSTGRTVVSDGWFMGRTTGLGMKKLTGVRSADLTERTAKLRGGALYGYQMDGYFGGCDGKTLSEILLMAENRAETTELVDGIKCLSFSANTKYGVVKISLDPAADFTLRYGRVDRQAKGISEVSVTQVERVGDWIVPVKGVYTSTFEGNVVRTSLQRSGIVLTQDVLGTDAFQMDFDEGARITDMDQNDRIFYIWQRGQMVPEGAEGIRTVSGGADSFGIGRAKSRMIWTVLLMLNASLLALFFLYRQRRKGGG